MPADLVQSRGAVGNCTAVNFLRSIGVVALVQLGIKNVLNTIPPYTNAGGQNYFQSGYDPGYADPRGRFIHATISYKFR